MKHVGRSYLIRGVHVSRRAHELPASQIRRQPDVNWPYAVLRKKGTMAQECFERSDRRGIAAQAFKPQHRMPTLVAVLADREVAQVSWEDPITFQVHPPPSDAVICMFGQEGELRSVRGGAQIRPLSIQAAAARNGSTYTSSAARQTPGYADAPVDALDMARAA